jgi:DNA-binding MarR family transcriptional regulator
VPESRIRDLEDILAMDQTTLTRNLALLERRGLIKVVGRPSGREKCWGLTTEGKLTLAAAKPLWETAQDEVRSRMGHQRTQAIHADVYDLVSRLS